MPIKTSLVIAILAVATGFFVTSNRILFGFKTGKLPDEYTSFVQTKDDVLDYYLEKHHKQIGDDYVPYRNHCLRVLAFTKYFLSLEDIQLEPHVFNIIAMALAYHDIALWTDGELDYLEPSAAQMSQRVQEEMKQSKQAETDEGALYVPKTWHWSTFEEDSNIAKAIILQHHKFTDYDHDKASGDANESGIQLQHMNEIVNAVRKADWADATMGIIRFGLPQSLLEAAYETIPDEGFHYVLLKMGPRLSPNSLVGQLQVLKILKW